ncbi:hypothetical protein [Streptomyces sp. NPDC006879]|uniref:hypothetical protein n=1 Tax=Streptomyces sp. NPDC006879 TaxID=3364767 RepID=UPI003683C6E0
MGREREIRTAEGDGPSRTMGDGDETVAGAGRAARAEGPRATGGTGEQQTTEVEEWGAGLEGAGTEASEDLPGLLAQLGRLLGERSPSDVAILLREDIERRELRAYAHGWQDAAAEYGPALEEARLGRTRPLRLVGRTPGQAAVIPFPQARTEEAPPRPSTGGDGPSEPAAAGDAVAAERGRSAPRSRARAGPAVPRRGAGAPEAEDTASDTRPAEAPGLVPKRRTSRVPTIPPLTPPRRRRRAGQGAAEGGARAAEEGPEGR